MTAPDDKPTGFDRSGVDDATETQPFGHAGHFTGRPMSRQDVPDMMDPLASAAAGAEGGDMQAAIDQALRERDEHRADLQRLAAEFDNYRKRVARDREQQQAIAHSRLLGELLDVLDNLERALEQCSEEQSAVRDGIRMVHDRLQVVLGQEGLSEIEAGATFDPNVHEAVMMQPHDTVAEGDIVTVVQKGFQIGDRILRPTKVIVSAGTG